LSYGVDAVKLDNSGQMRIIEAMIACVILIFGIFATSYFSSVFTTVEGGELEESGQSVIHVLENTDLIKQIVQNESNWESKLKSLIGTLLPPGTLYNLTLASLLTSQTFAAVTNIQEQSISPNLDAVSIQSVITISLPLTRVEQKKLDVMLIIDRSTSMSQENKIYYAKQAATTFIDQLNSSRDRVGLVSYSDTATLNSILTDNFQYVKTQINSLFPYGYTNIGEGVKKSNDEFLAHNRTDALHAMILLTDGVANRPCPHSPPHVTTTCPVARQYALDESIISQSRDILIYTIGLGSNKSDFDEDLLKDMQTNGYYYAPSGEDLEAIYMAIAQDLLFAVKYDIVVMTLTLIKAG
jgi:hypothetical protein